VLAASGIGSLVQPMVWYYQTAFSLPAGLPHTFSFCLIDSLTGASLN